METPVTEKDEPEKSEYHSFYDVARRILLAGIGAIAISHDEIEEFVDKLVERGEIARKDRENLLAEMRERRKKFFEDEQHHAHKAVDKIFDHLQVPMHKDVEELSQKISELEKKIEQLLQTKK